MNVSYPRCLSNVLQLNEKLATVVQDALERSQDPDRSPSPPPRYDGNGVRTNTRDVRMREALNKERSEYYPIRYNFRNFLEACRVGLCGLCDEGALAAHGFNLCVCKAVAHLV